MIPDSSAIATRAATSLPKAWDATRTARASGVQEQVPTEQNDDGDDMAMTIQAIDNTLAPIDTLDDLLALAGV